MKKLMLFFLVICFKLFAQSGYNIELKKIYCEWLDFKSSSDSVETIIRDNNGNILPPSNDFYYEYHAITNNLVNPPHEDVFGDLGLNKTFEDNDYNFIQTWYVIIKDPTQTNILGTSNTVEFRLETDPYEAKKIIFQALKSNGNTEAGVGLNHWMYVCGLWNLNFTAYSNYLTLFHSEVLRSSPGFLTANNDKFNYWNTDQTLVLNHKNFYYEENATEHVIANYKTSYNGVTIQYNMDGFSDDLIDFKDPWLVDYNDQPYGMRNQGINAPFKKVPSPFNPSIGSQYRGVLLNQSGPPNWNPPYYSINVPTSINFPDKGGVHNIYLQNWNVSGASLQYPNSLTSGVVFTSTSGAAITANLKAQGLSDNSNTFSYNNQRRFLQTLDGTLFNLYNSIGKVWLELYTGSGWIINNSAPLSSNLSKEPSMDYASYSSHGSDPVNQLLVVFQEKAGNDSKITVQYYEKSDLVENPLWWQLLDSKSFTAVSGQYDNIDCIPVIAFNPISQAFKIVFKASDGLYFKTGSVSASNLPPPGGYVGITMDNSSSVKISGTNSSSINPSIYTTKENIFYRLVWEENNNIKYVEEISAAPAIQTISSLSAFTYHNNPSLIVLGDNLARICWKGTRYVPSIDPVTKTDNSYWDTRIVFRGINNNHFWYFGNNVSAPNINRADAESYYALTWNQNENLAYFTDNSLGTPKLVSDNGFSGSNVQVSNGATKSQMYIEEFNRGSLPYFFRTSNNLNSYYSPQKVNNYNFASGREGTITKDSAHFYFTVGDILVDNQPVDFVEIPDSVTFNTEEVLNNYLVSNPFELTNNSSFQYSVQFGISDSISAANLLENSDNYVNFRLQLVDVQTSEVLGNYDDVMYDEENIYQYSSQCYQVNTNGIGDREVYLRLITDNNFDPGYSLSEIYSLGNVLEKIAMKTKNYDGKQQVTEYELSQNYPNPFNPTSTINYQLPQTGHVTLKVYDILGKEVATLVDEQKAQGRYSVNFDASRLASGVYIYRIQVNDYVSSKKMLLVK